MTRMIHKRNNSLFLLIASICTHIYVYMHIESNTHIMHYHAHIYHIHTYMHTLHLQYTDICLYLYVYIICIKRKNDGIKISTVFSKNLKPVTHIITLYKDE